MMRSDTPSESFLSDTERYWWTGRGILILKTRGISRDFGFPMEGESVSEKQLMFLADQGRLQDSRASLGFQEALTLGAITNDPADKKDHLRLDLPAMIWTKKGILDIHGMGIEGALGYPEVGDDLTEGQRQYIENRGDWSDKFIRVHFNKKGGLVSKNL